MKLDLRRASSELAYRIRNSVTAQLLIVLAVAVMFTLVIKYLASASGCGSNVGDGPCGTSTFFGDGFAYAGGFAIFCIGGTRVFYADLKRRRAHPIRVKDRTAADDAHDFGAALFQDRLVDDQASARDEREPSG
jgi:hypothetical protein